MRPRYVAVEMATGTSVLALTSCSKTSIAKSTPPTSVLKVAAIPPLAPAAIKVFRCQAGAIKPLNYNTLGFRVNELNFDFFVKLYSEHTVTGGIKGQIIELKC